MSENPASLFRRRQLDLVYWLFVTPFVTGALTRLATIGAFGVWSMYADRFVIGLGFWAELLMAMLLADIAGYWSHRARHTRWLWPFHAIHHSPTRLDALAGARMHPVDDIIDNTFVGLVLFVAGFQTNVIFAIGPILFAHLALIHADRPWDFGRLCKILVSPAHHRAHHEVGGDRNFAGMFSFVDLLFGTYAVSAGKPHGSGEPIAESLNCHIQWPFQALVAKVRRRQSGTLRNR